MGADGITDDEFAVIAGPGAEGTLMTFSPDPRLNPANKAIIEVFRKKGFEPQAYTLYSYAAVQVIKQAAEAAKSLDPKKVAEVMHSGKVFNTVLGDISFDKKGDVTGYTIGGKKKTVRDLRLEEGPRRQDHLRRAVGFLTTLTPAPALRGGRLLSDALQCREGLRSASC